MTTTLGDLRAQGIREVLVDCRDCKRQSTLNVDLLRDVVKVTDVALRARCSGCMSRRVVTKPPRAFRH